MAVLHEVPKWLQENAHFFVPPVCNKMMYGQGQLKAFFVGGPNQRKDFHIEEGEEFFYMLKGEMILRVMERGQFRDIPIKEGQVFLLPGRIPHSPQRNADTLGFVSEREREPHEMDCLRYFVEDDSGEILFERWFHCDDLGTQLVPIIREFFASEQHRTGKPIPGTVTSNPPVELDTQRHLGDAFSLDDWIKQNQEEILRLGKKALFDQNQYRSKVEILGPGQHVVHEPDVETFLWQWKGTADLSVEGSLVRALQENTTALVPAGKQWRLDAQTGLTLSIRLTP